MEHDDNIGASLGDKWQVSHKYLCGFTMSMPCKVRGEQEGWTTDASHAAESDFNLTRQPIIYKAN